jgi:hypothetical protein
MKGKDGSFLPAHPPRPSHLAAPVAAFGLVRVSRAQPESPCGLGFVHGLLQFDLDCPLLDPHEPSGPATPTDHGGASSLVLQRHIT